MQTHVIDLSAAEDVFGLPAGIPAYEDVDLSTAEFLPGLGIAYNPTAEPDALNEALLRALARLWQHYLDRAPQEQTFDEIEADALAAELHASGVRVWVSTSR